MDREQKTPKVAEIGPRRPKAMSMALLTGLLPTMVGMGGAGADALSRPMAPAQRGSKTLDQMDDAVRDDEARKAKAEAKRRRRMERNRKLARKTQ